MRIGLITFHRAINYGAVLQAYALQRSIEELSEHRENDCLLIDYRCDLIEKSYSFFSFRNTKSAVGFIKGLVASPLKAIILAEKRKKYHAFSKTYLKLLKLKKNNTDDCADRFDVFITGSDQVWNYRHTGDDDAYFLDFVREKEKKYSYAASFGQDQYFKGYRDRILNNIKSFQTISLREPIGADQIQKSFADIRVDIDPTLLLSFEKWNELIGDNNKRGDYILVYCVAEPDRLLSQVNKFAQKKGIRIYCITDSFLIKKRYPLFHIIRACGPIEFLTLIKNAKYVFTTSFHGTAFSVIFHKKFYAEIENKDGYNVRVANILDSLGLMRCADYQQIENERFLTENDWEEADKKLNFLRNRSLDYLRSIVREE